MKHEKKPEQKQPTKARELNQEELEKASGGGDNPFKDVPRVTNHDYDETIKSKI